MELIIIFSGWFNTDAHCSSERASWDCHGRFSSQFCKSSQLACFFFSSFTSTLLSSSWFPNPQILFKKGVPLLMPNKSGARGIHTAASKVTLYCNRWTNTHVDGNFVLGMRFVNSKHWLRRWLSLQALIVLKYSRVTLPSSTPWL